jgi:hypothetical protein
MYTKNFLSEFLDIFKNNFWTIGASTPVSQSAFLKEKRREEKRRERESRKVTRLGFGGWNGGGHGCMLSLPYPKGIHGRCIAYQFWCRTH